LPQALLCGLIVPRDQMATWLEWLSNAMPLSYAVEAMQQLGTRTTFTGVLARDLAVVAGCTLLALLLGAATLRRRAGERRGPKSWPEVTFDRCRGCFGGV
jgi:ABC-2 type transport system permease protein